MDYCGEILKDREDNRLYNYRKNYEKIIEEFSKEIKAEELFSFDESVCITDRFKRIKKYAYDSEYKDLFYSILKKYNYNMKDDIKEAMFILGDLLIPSINKKAIEKCLKSPVIQDVSYDNHSFKLCSKYGNFNIFLPISYFNQDKEMKKYIKKYKLLRICHDNTYFISTRYDDLYSITSLCKSSFNTAYYHSYTYDKEDNKIIDICYNAVMPKSQYYKLFKPQEISVIKNSDVERQVELTDLKTSQNHNRCELLRVALYKEYLNSIGYKGDFKYAPSIKQKNLKI